MYTFCNGIYTLRTSKAHGEMNVNRKRANAKVLDSRYKWQKLVNAYVQNVRMNVLQAAAY